MDILGEDYDSFEEDDTNDWSNWRLLDSYIMDNDNERRLLFDDIGNLSKKLALNLVEESKRITVNNLEETSGCHRDRDILNGLLDRHSTTEYDILEIVDQLDRLLEVDWTSPGSCLLQARALRVFMSYVDKGSSYLQLMLAFQEILGSAIKIGNLIILDKQEVANFDEAIWWTCKKWSLILLVKLFNPFCVYEKNRIKRIQKHSLADKIVLPILKTIQGILTHELCPSETLGIAKTSIVVIFYSTLPQRLKDELKLTIVKTVIFPLLCHTKYDEELYNTHPAEYCRSAFQDYNEENLDRFRSFSDTLQVILNEFTRSLKLVENLIEYALEILDKPDEHDLREKESSIYVVGVLIHRMRDLQDDGRFETEIWRHINNYIVNRDPFLRARTCWLVSRLANNHFFAKSETIDYSSFFESTESKETELCVKIEILLLFKHLTTSKGINFNGGKHIESVISDFIDMIRISRSKRVIICANFLARNYSKELTGLIPKIGRQLSVIYDEISHDRQLAENEKASLLRELLQTFGILFDSSDWSG